MSETQGIVINYKNYNPDFEGVDGEGISIYNQRYSLDEQISGENGLSLDVIKETLAMCIKGNLEKINQETSLLFDNVPFEKRSDNAFVMVKDHLLVFECQKEGKFSYYCYLKDHYGNSWLVYIIKDKVYPVVFDLQDDLELVVTLANPQQIEGSDYYTGTITSISTGNFYIGGDGNVESSVLKYSDITLKNTSFNLAIDEVTEKKVTIIPKYALTIGTEPEP